MICPLKPDLFCAATPALASESRCPCQFTEIVEKNQGVGKSLIPMVSGYVSCRGVVGKCKSPQVKMGISYYTDSAAGDIFGHT